MTRELLLEVCVPSFEVLLFSLCASEKSWCLLCCRNVESIVLELLNGPVLRHDLAVGMLMYSPLL